jgi:ATP adenylyltransferase
MTKERMWAPWRGNYILEANKPQKNCLFCEMGKKKESKQDLLLYFSEFSFVIMNKFPYNNGHIMVVPKKHADSPEKLSEQEYLDLSKVLKLSLNVIKNVYNPQGCNIGMNLGKVAGAGIDEHIHYHIVPRWNGDTNFLPVFTEVKVIPEHIETSYDRILEGFRKTIKA